MKTFAAALLAAAVCLLAASGAVEASRVGPARQLQQFNNGLGASCCRARILEQSINISSGILQLVNSVLMHQYRLMSYVRRGMSLLLLTVHSADVGLLPCARLSRQEIVCVDNEAHYLESNPSC